MEDRNKDKIMILDGFPRTLQQGIYFQNLIENLNINVKFFLLYCKDEICIERMVNRQSCNECKSIYNLKYSPPLNTGFCDICNIKLDVRSTDNREESLERLRIFKENSKDLINFYTKKKLVFQVYTNDNKNNIFSIFLKSISK